MCTTLVHVPWGAVLGEPFLCPPLTLVHQFQSGRTTCAPPVPPAPTRVLYYHTLLSRRLETWAVDEGETETRVSDLTKREKKKKMTVICQDSTIPVFWR